jgi:predicted ATP-grasp superfamily ATP-dependent carboligase
MFEAKFSLGRDLWGDLNGASASEAKSELIPAVVIGGTGPGTLGLLRSLSSAGIPVVLLDDDPSSAAMHSRHGYKIAAKHLSGEPLVEQLLSLATALGCRPVLLLNSDEAVLTISEYRAHLEGHYSFLSPSHDCVTSLINKTSFQQFAEANSFAVPRSVTINKVADMGRLAQLRYPCIVKPTWATPEYVRGQFERAYKVATSEAARKVCLRILAVVPDLVVQEWIEGPDSNLYFCLQYRGVDGSTVCTFTGRKLSVWPADVGVTASCTAAPEADSILQPLTTAFFDKVSFVGMGGIEFKRDARTGSFLMIEPTVGRIDGQEEVATLHGCNIPAAAYFYQIGSVVPSVLDNRPPVIWRDSISHWKAVSRQHASLSSRRGMKIYDAYWRRDDPVPILFHLRRESEMSLRRTLRRVPFLSALVRSLRRTAHFGLSKAQ